MQVPLSPELEQFVRQKVATGGYDSPAQVVQDALRLLREQDEVNRLRHEELRKEIMIGIEQANRGESAPLDMEAIKAKVRQRLREERGENG